MLALSILGRPRRPRKGLFLRMTTWRWSSSAAVAPSAPVPRGLPRPGDWRGVIGLEVHAQIATTSKLFSASATPSWTSCPPNSRVALFDAAIPGTLPTVNRACVEAGVRTALALNCRLNSESTFDRKHYFYADLPSGYQITQQRRPLAVAGSLDFSVLRSSTVPQTYVHRVGLTQLQLEQDSGKSLHDVERGQSLIDLNRCGVGLMEMVFEPELADGEEAAALIKELMLILRKLDTCSCRMEDGALRVDANISVHRAGHPLGVRTEVKNINSVRAVANAVEYEVQRQINVLEAGGVVENETRSYDSYAKKTVPMRDKEAKQDYRFMPEPNLPPLRLRLDDDAPPSENAHVVDVPALRTSMPELPAHVRQRLTADMGLSVDHAYRMINEPRLLDFFLACVGAEEGGQVRPQKAKVVADLLFIEVMGHLEAKEASLDDLCLTPDQLAELAEIKLGNDLPHNILIVALKILFENNYASAEDLIREKGWRASVRDREKMAREIDSILEKHPKAVRKYCRGKASAAGKMHKEMSRFAEELDLAMMGAMLKEELEKRKEKAESEAA